MVWACREKTGRRSVSKRRGRKQEGDVVKIKSTNEGWLKNCYMGIGKEEASPSSSKLN